MEHQTYQYFEYSKYSHPSHKERSRAKSAISIPKVRTCCECGAEECPRCGDRSSSPSKSNRASLREFHIPKQYYNLVKSTTHESYRAYESQMDKDMLFSFPAGRANPDEQYFDRSLNDTGSGEKRKFSNIERYKEASPVLKRVLQSHINEILGHNDAESKESSPGKEKYSKDIFPQGHPVGIYRNDSRGTNSPSPKPNGKVPWQRITKKDLSPEKKKLLRLQSSPLKKAEEVKEMGEEAKWKSGKRDISPNSLSKFQDKVKQASMLLKNSKGKYSGSVDPEFMVQTYVGSVAKGEHAKRKEKFFNTDFSTQEDGRSWISRSHSQRKFSSKSVSRTDIKSTEEIESNLPTEGDVLMKDILRRYGNANRSKVSSVPQIQNLSGNLVEGGQQRNKSYRGVGDSSNGSTAPLMTEPELSDQRDEILIVESARNKRGSREGQQFSAEARSTVTKKSSFVRDGVSKEFEEEAYANKKEAAAKGGSQREETVGRSDTGNKGVVKVSSHTSLMRENSVDSLQPQVKSIGQISANGFVDAPSVTELEESNVEIRPPVSKKASLTKVGSQASLDKEKIILPASRGNPIQGPQLNKKNSQGSIPVVKEPGTGSNREEPLARQNNGSKQGVKASSQNSLKRENSVETFQPQVKSIGQISASGLPGTPFQAEQESVEQVQETNVEMRPPVSKKASLIREGSQTSVGVEKNTVRKQSEVSQLNKRNSQEGAGSISLVKEPEIGPYREEPLARQNTGSKQGVKASSQNSVKRENSVEAFQPQVKSIGQISANPFQVDEGNAVQGQESNVEMRTVVPKKPSLIRDGSQASIEGDLKQKNIIPRGNSGEVSQSSKKNSQEENGSLSLIKDSETSPYRGEPLTRQHTGSKQGAKASSQNSLKRENSVEAFQPQVKSIGQITASGLPGTPSQVEQESFPRFQESNIVIRQAVSKRPSLREESQSPVGKEGDLKQKSGLVEPVSYKEKRLERQNSQSQQMKGESSVESFPITKSKSENFGGKSQAEQEQIVYLEDLLKQQETGKRHMAGGDMAQGVIDSRKSVAKKLSFEGEVSFTRGVSQEEFNPYKKPPSMKDIAYEGNPVQELKQRVRTSESVNSNDNQQYISQQQATLRREGSQDSLRREESIESSQMRRKETGNSSSSNGCVAPFQTEQVENQSPLINNTLNKSGSVQYSTEGKPPASKKSSLAREDSQVSLVRDSSVEEFNTNRKPSSIKEIGFGEDVEQDSKQEDTQVYHSVKKAIPQYPSMRKGGSYKSLTSESEGQEPGLSKKKVAVSSLNVLSSQRNEQPFKTEPDGSYDSPHIIYNISDQKTVESISGVKSGSTEHVDSTQVNSIEKSQLRKTFSLQEGQFVKEPIQRYNSQAEHLYSQEAAKKPSESVIVKVQQIQQTTVLQPPKRMAGDVIEEVADQEIKESKPVRLNSWGSVQKSLNDNPKVVEVNNSVEEMKAIVKNVASVSVTDVEPAVPVQVIETKKASEIEDIIRFGNLSIEKENDLDKGTPKISNQNIKSTGPREIGFGDSYSMDKSISYEISFEENSYERGSYSKMSQGLTGSNLVSQQVSERDTKSTLPVQGDKYKVVTRFGGAQGFNNSLTDDSHQNHLATASTVDFHERNSPFLDMRGDQGKYKREEAHSKVLRPKDIGSNLPSPWGTENVNVSKVSFSVEPMSAVRMKDEFRKDCKVEYCEVKVVYKDDYREAMLKNFMSGKMIPSVQTKVQGNLSARRDLFGYNK